MSNYILENYLDSKMEGYFYNKLPLLPKEKVKTRIKELLKYLILGGHTSGDIPFNQDIDDVWHLWIMQTIQYKELMNQLPHKKFIHHCSNSYIDPHKPQDSEEVKIQKQISYLASYVYNFGPITEDVVDYYPFAFLLMSMKNMNLDSLNKFLLELSKVAA